jgi:hypothetical protein
MGINDLTNVTYTPSMNQTAFMQSQSFLVQFLKDAGFNGSLEPGTAIYDVIIKPLALLYVLFDDVTERAKAYSSIAYANKVKDRIGSEEYSKIIDMILSNWFVSRGVGRKTECIVRLYFNKQIEYLEINNNNSSFSINKIKFEIPDNILPVVISPNLLNEYYNTNRYKIEYYYDLTLESTVLSKLEPADTQPYYEIISAINSIYYLRAEFLSIVTLGYPQESDEDFIRRTSQVITTREFISQRAIRTVLLDKFSDIKNIYVAGYGDAEQLRDIVQVETGTSLHVGNKADVYISTNLTRYKSKVSTYKLGDTEVYSLDVSAIGTTIADIMAVRDYRAVEGTLCITTNELPNSTVTIADTGIFTVGDTTGGNIYPLMHSDRVLELTANDFKPILDPKGSGYFTIIKVVSDILPDSNTVLKPVKGLTVTVGTVLQNINIKSIYVDTDFAYRKVPYLLTARNQTEYCAIPFKPYITVTSEYAGGVVGAVELEYVGSNVYNEVYAYIFNDINRVVCFDPLIKTSYVLSFYVDISVEIKYSYINTYEDNIKQAVVTYFSTLKVITDFTIYNLIGYLYENAASISSVALPVTITLSLRDPDTFNTVEYTAVNNLSLSDMLKAINVTNLQVTLNTVQSFIDAENVHINVSSVNYN